MPVGLKIKLNRYWSHRSPDPFASGSSRSGCRAGPCVGPDLVSGHSACRARPRVEPFRGSGAKDGTASRKVRPYHEKNHGRAVPRVGPDRVSSRSACRAPKTKRPHEVGARSRALGRRQTSQPQIARKRAPTYGNLVNLMGESSVSPSCLVSGSICGSTTVLGLYP